MDLFAASGVDLSEAGRGGGRPGRLPARLLRVPLLNRKVVEDARRLAALSPSGGQLAAANDYARKAASPRFLKQAETAVRGLFVDQVLGAVLGYRGYDPEATYTLAIERPIRRGAVDVALGRFPGPAGVDEILAPFELKGPGTRDLDAIMPGRGRSPVQQAWDYAIDAPGSRWVLVSNCLEIRLYAWGHGRDAYELFDLTKLNEPEELARLMLVLSAERLLGGATEALLDRTENAYREITGQLYTDYRTLRERLIAFLIDSADGPKLPPLRAIEAAQKLLDRILFMAFAQSTALLPEKLLERAAASRNDFNPQPLWRNFLNLFRDVDRGNPRLYIWPYNGGLFAPDPVADAVILPDALAEDVVGLGQWDYGSDVPVTVLGHIFEQSITDLETLRAEKSGQAAPGVSKKKREGVVYTPDIVTRFLVERTIGATLRERRDDRLPRFAENAAFPDNGDAIRWRAEGSEAAFWREDLESLRGLTVVDPACGSGAFLVAAFDFLAREYRQAATRLADLGEPVDFDIFDEIVTRNLHGVDLNAESVEITRLALWLKTARRQHRLQNLEATIKVGDSLIEDAAYTERPFDWRAAFPDVFARGGFDVVIGNPPYVRSETISDIKPWLKLHYAVFDSGADLYCYFFELGLSILREGGRLGFIASSGFLKTAFGGPLRQELSSRSIIEAGVDFGDVRIFADVTTYPIALSLKKERLHTSYQIRYLVYRGTPKDDLSMQFDTHAFSYPSERLQRSRWHFEPEPLWTARDHLENAAASPLSAVSVPASGIKTGLTEAFIISDQQREQFVRDAPSSRDVIRPWLIGNDVAKWSPETARKHLIFFPKGWTQSNLGRSDETKAWSGLRLRYPSVAHWLQSFEAKARSRSDQGDFWWELRACDYYELFDQDLIVFPEMSQGPKFALKRSGTVSNNKTFLLPHSTYGLLSYLNSRVCWFLLNGICTSLRGGVWRLELRADFLRDLPVPDLDGRAAGALSPLGQRCALATERTSSLNQAVQRRFLDLAPAGHTAKLSRKLESWWELDFAAFRAEVKRVFRAEIPVKQRADWEAYLAENAAQVRALTAEIEAAERDIDAIVYRLFDLNAEEIALLEASLQGQY